MFKNILIQSLKFLTPTKSSSCGGTSLLIKQSTKLFSISFKRYDLTEFFDDKANLQETKIKHGREWYMEELRLKSNPDLHKLWYVLHKERNMLLTMEECYKKYAEPFPSPERIAKVDESMENLLAVVEERNIAYNLLETGETKINLPYRRYNSFGYIQRYRPREYLVPWWINKMWKLKYHYKKLPLWSKMYRTLLRVRLRKDRNKIKKRINYEKKRLFSKHSDLLTDQTDFVQSVLEKKYDYKPPMPYHELIRRPLPDEQPRRTKSKSKFEDDLY